MCLDSVIGMNETLNSVPGDNSDADIDLGYEKNFHNGLSDYDNESLYLPIVPTLSKESAIPMIADQDAVDYIPINPPPCDRSHGCAHGAPAHAFRERERVHEKSIYRGDCLIRWSLDSLQV